MMRPTPQNRMKGGRDRQAGRWHSPPGLAAGVWHQRVPGAGGVADAAAKWLQTRQDGLRHCLGAAGLAQPLGLRDQTIALMQVDAIRAAVLCRYGRLTMRSET